MFASGLRNPNGLNIHPETGELWTVVNERDELGPNLVPDYMTSVRENGFYGWPWSYYGQNVDERVRPPRPDLVETAISPGYALTSHVAALGLAFTNDSAMPGAYRNGAFVGNRGSWNRKTFNGYKVIYIPFTDGRPSGMAQDVVTGFLDGEDARGRPVGLAIDGTGALLIADDAGNTVWRVAAADGSVTPEPIPTERVVDEGAADETAVEGSTSTGPAGSAPRPDADNSSFVASPVILRSSRIASSATFALNSAVNRLRVFMLDRLFHRAIHLYATVSQTGTSSSTCGPASMPRASQNTYRVSASIERSPRDATRWQGCPLQSICCGTTFPGLPLLPMRPKEGRGHSGRRPPAPRRRRR